MKKTKEERLQRIANWLRKISFILAVAFIVMMCAFVYWKLHA